MILQNLLCRFFAGYKALVNLFLHLSVDKDAVNELMVTVDEACLLLGDYNGRLAAELEERKRVAKMLFDYIVAQKESLNVAQNRLMV